MATKKTSTAATAQAAPAVGGSGIRVRMYRVGFGDFFLLTVPGNDGPAHILIDCGVHHTDIHTMDDCVDDLIRETQGKLALVILTHYHADHMSGFATNAAKFAKCQVGAVWITNRLDPKDKAHAQFHAGLVAVAQKLQMRLQLAARQDEAAAQALAKVGNALGVAGAAGDAGGGSNAKALALLASGFGNRNTPVHYYQGGDEPELPAELKGRLKAQILAPAPKARGAEFSATDRAEQYLAAAAANADALDEADVRPFGPEWSAGRSDYWRTVDAARASSDAELDAQARELEERLQALRPDTLLAAAAALDGTLNNSSLVVLFTCQGKKLLFVGDAQWGNWSYWLYGKQAPGKDDPGLLAQAKQILGGIDFYKIGHHGSTNANPIPAMALLNAGCACMCSTATGAYGKVENSSEVPRGRLLDALKGRLRYAPVRSDWLPVDGEPKDPKDAYAQTLKARAAMPRLPPGFSTDKGKSYIDFHL